MAILEKQYDYSPAVLLNIVNDIAEMRKANVTRLDAERLLVDTEMYGIKTGYVFRIVPVGAGTSISVETGGESGGAGRNVDLMFATIENMLGLFKQ